MEPDGNSERRKEAVATEGRFVKLELRVDRLVSDAESEKRTRANSNLDIAKDFLKVEAKMEKLEARIRHLEHKMYGFAGGISVVVYAIHWFFK